eukprot:480751-Pelagomonas_calceolata.AAC.2
MIRADLECGHLTCQVVPVFVSPQELLNDSMFCWEGKDRIAVPAYESSIAEAKKSQHSKHSHELQVHRVKLANPRTPAWFCREGDAWHLRPMLAMEGL